MDNDYWLKKWETKDIFFHRDEINPDVIELFPSLHLKIGAQIFVPLCGKSRDMIWFSEQGYSVLGIDISSIACLEFFKDQQINPAILSQNGFVEYYHENIRLLSGDFFKLTTKDVPPIDVIYDAKALIALSPEIQQKYVNQLILLMSDHTKIFLIALSTPHPVEGPPYSTSESKVQELFGLDFEIKILKSQQLQKLSKHLIQNKFTDVIETIYLISKKI